MHLMEGEDRGLRATSAPPPVVLPELSSVSLKGMGEEQAHQVGSALSASSKAIAEVASCISPC